MILIRGQSQYVKAELLVHAITEEVESQIEMLERSGFIVSLTNLPPHIDTHEVYAAIMLDKFAEMCLPETEKLNQVTKFH